MMVVSVEVWPGGDLLTRKVIHTINVGNISQLAELSDYEYSIDGEYRGMVIGHERSKGALELVRRIIEQEQS